MVRSHMYMVVKTISIFLILLSIAVGIESRAAEPLAGPRLGRVATAGEVANWNIDIWPDGRGLPAGQGDAAAGRRVYDRHCLSCHGADGLGDSGDQLAGAQMQLTDPWPEKTIGTYWPFAPVLFDFIRRSMPMETPGVLSNDELYAVTAYLLYLNGIIDEHAVMNAETLSTVRMPNRAGFVDGRRMRER